MKLFHLEPRPGTKGSDAWKTSDFVGYLVIAAETEEQARRIACDARFKAAEKPHSEEGPICVWLLPQYVSCVEVKAEGPVPDKPDIYEEGQSLFS